MTIEEKQEIASVARKLISLLDYCNDGEFVDLVISCVASNDTSGIEPEDLYESC